MTEQQRNAGRSPHDAKTFKVGPGLDARENPAGTALWVRLGHNARPCGGCSCSWCVEHPDEEPAWDTMSISPDGRAWTIHAPEFWSGGPLRKQLHPGGKLSDALSAAADLHGEVGAATAQELRDLARHAELLETQQDELKHEVAKLDCFLQEGGRVLKESMGGAPDLLAALEGLEPGNALHCRQPINRRDCCECPGCIARAAIAKAKGGA